jgi:TatD family hydrolase
MQFVDTHCHIHEAPSANNANDATHALWLKAETRDADELMARAAAQGVTRLICVGTTAEDSRRAIEFVQTRANAWASIGLHPHEAKYLKDSIPVLRSLLANDRLQNSEAPSGPEGFASSLRGPVKTPLPLARSGYTARPQRSEDEWGGALRDEARGVVLAKSHPSGPVLEASASSAAASLAERKIVAIGECGLDYFYNHSNKKDQAKALRAQLELAVGHNLPVIFHVREAFDDFWPIFDSYKGLHGVLHSYTDNQANLQKALERDLFIGANGIMTFTKEQQQLEVAKAVPLEKLLLETDAPFLTPVPFRGRVNEPAHVRLVADFLAHLRGEPLAELANQTSANAQTLFFSNKHPK